MEPGSVQTNPFTPSPLWNTWNVLKCVLWFGDLSGKLPTKTPWKNCFFWGFQGAIVAGFQFDNPNAFTRRSAILLDDTRLECHGLPEAQAQRNTKLWLQPVWTYYSNRIIAPNRVKKYIKIQTVETTTSVWDFRLWISFLKLLQFLMPSSHSPNCPPGASWGQPIQGVRIFKSPTGLTTCPT